MTKGKKTGKTEQEQKTFVIFYFYFQKFISRTETGH